MENHAFHKLKQNDIERESGLPMIQRPNDLKTIGLQEESAIIPAFDGQSQLQTCDPTEDIDELSIESFKSRRGSSKKSLEIFKSLVNSEKPQQNLSEDGDDDETSKSEDISSTPFDLPNVIDVPKGLADAIDKISSTITSAKETSEIIRNKVQNGTKDWPSLKKVFETLTDSYISKEQSKKSDDVDAESKKGKNTSFNLNNFIPSPELYRKSIIPLSNTEKPQPYTVPSMSGGILGAQSTAKGIVLKQQSNILAASPRSAQDLPPKNVFQNRSMSAHGAVARPPSRSPQRVLERSPTTLSSANNKLPWSKKRPDLF